MRPAARPKGIAPRIGLAIVCGAVASGAAPAAESVVVERLQAFRADHMVLDAVSRGSLILAGTQSGEVAVFDWQEGRQLEVLMSSEAKEGQAFAPTVQSVAVSPSQNLCAVVTSDGMLRVLRLEAADVGGGLKGEPVFSLERPGLMVARFVGAGDTETAQRVTNQALLVGAAMAVVARAACRCLSGFMSDSRAAATCRSWV